MPKCWHGRKRRDLPSRAPKNVCTDMPSGQGDGLEIRAAKEMDSKSMALCPQANIFVLSIHGLSQSPKGSSLLLSASARPPLPPHEVPRASRELLSLNRLLQARCQPLRDPPHRCKKRV
eukprot:3729881-Amphidinium_carterae.1